MNKYKLYMIVSIIILIMSIGGSFAWYTWESTNNISANLGFCVPEISFIGGTTINGEGLVPVTSKDKGLKKQIDVYLNKTCKEGDSGVMNLYMKLDVLPASLRHETFMFEVVTNDEVIYSGNFKDKEEGQTIELLTNKVITEDDSIYFVYVYIDGTRDNPIEMSKQSFRFTVWGEGTGAIYKNNVITNPTTPSNSSSNFLNTEIVRNSIQTITIAEDNTVPDSVPEENTKDISSEGDGSVMLWYTDDDGDGKLDIYMGSENGVIETNTNGQGMFAYLENVESLDLTNLDTSNITNMSSMFKGSSSLKEIKLSNFDTSSVTSMKDMFYGCSSLTNIDLSSFDTKKVTTMYGMFEKCSSLISLDLSGFDTSNLTIICSGYNSYGNIFQDCTSLVSLNLNGWNTSKISCMSYMFVGCKSLKSLDLSSFDTKKVTTMAGMFQGCSSLTELDLSNFDTSNVTAMGSPGYEYGGMFQGCSKLTYLNLSSFNTSKVTTMANLFNGCSSLTALDLNSFDTSNVTTMYRMFQYCSSLTELDLSNFNTEKNTSMQYMFYNCKSLKTLNISNFNTAKVTNMFNTFGYCSSLALLDLSSFDTQNVKNMRYMFSYCSSLTSLDLSSFNISSVNDMQEMFHSCSKLTTIYVSNLWDTSGVTASSAMFYNCKSLVGGNGTVFNIYGATDKTYARIDSEGTPGYLTLKEEI